jgi:putative ubiquitin-RnfH superfamily antitoxin RatB of RatAB toxin-antitoxin module
LQHAPPQISDATLRVEIAYAESQRAIVKVFHLSPGSRVADALELAARDPDLAALNLAGSAIGIFGRVVRPDQPLNDGDRLEIYRPLAADPKAARRARVQQARKQPLRPR